ncbi:MAG: glucoamylase family protein, partial [Gemmatimonadaceae bacterium]
MATVLPPTRGPNRILARFFSRTADRDSAASEFGAPIVGPIRGELLGAEGMAERAREVARAQRVVPPTVRPRREPGGGPLFRRLAETQVILTAAQETLGDAADRGVDVSPAGDWLLDNYYVVEEHIREIRESMPAGYYRELPKLATGTLEGYPRVYEVAIEVIAHTEGRLTLDNIETFVAEFQRVTPLTLGELWAIPAMLRLGLLENVRRLTLRTTQRLRDVEEADAWAERLRRAAGERPDDGAAPSAHEASQALARALSDFVSSHPPLTPAFVTRFLQQIRGAQTTFTPLVWLEHWIAEDGLTAEDAAARSNQRLALTQVMMANSITSLRAIARLDWKSFVERQSVLERVLRNDPSGHYPALTFATRDHYRHVVEHVARRTRRAEREVAEVAVALARGWRRGEHPMRTGDERRAHVGFYLVDEGRRELERAVGYRPTSGERLHRWVLRNPNKVYFGAMALGTWAALSAAVAVSGAESVRAQLLVVLLALLPASEVAISVLNQLVTLLMPPRELPKLELREKGIPAEYRTAVVVPTLFGSVEAVREALEHLEVQYLANRDEHLHFAILGDFTDSPTETRPGDDEILRAAADGVRELNEKYAGGDPRVFYLLHRPRRWNEQQGVWMGWERKRGKLAQFNQLIRGGAADAFSTIVGDLAPLREVRYVITLDSDTVLPPDAAHALVGTMAHPLIRPVYDPRVGRVVRGYGILQPRVGVSLPSAHRSLFASIHSGHPGVDPYSTAVSDVYQDLFAEGSFTGKGIYDVDAFEQATHARFPENTLLSHDLIEGNYARAGLVTDVEVYDDYPTRYLTYTRRKHRWIRGDWQLLRWLRTRVPGPEGKQRNRLSAISRWKIVDNLRRSLIEIAQLALLVAGWTVLPGTPLRWTAVGLVAIAVPWLFSLFLALVRPPRDKSWPAYYAAVGRDAVTSAQQFALAVVFLPHQAVVSADAIVRTLYRLAVSKRNLLEWQTASQVERAAARSGREVWHRMWPATAVSFAIVLAVVGAALASPAGTALRGEWWQWSGILPLVALWLCAPWVAQRLSAPAVRRELRLSVADRRAALRYALLHWRFFDRFVTEEHNWLAPDNFQEDPHPVVAPRTSPTNLGLQLLAVVSAYDLGFLTSAEVAERLERVFRTLERLRRFRGHFYNWYDTTTLAVLEPAYVSTVDSGNLAGHLLALRQACLTIPDEPVFDSRVWRALEAGLSIVRDSLSELASSGDVASPAEWQALAAAGESVRRALSLVGHAAASGGDATPTHGLARVAAEVHDAERRLADAGLRPGDAHAGPAAQALELLGWCAGIASRCGERLTAVVGDAQVAAAPRGAGGTGGTGAAGQAPTLRELAETSTAASETIASLQVIADRARDFALEMDFRFLFEERRKLFAIGFNAQSGELDASFYDLLASESRLASFLAIAKDDAPVEHWFRLGRTLTTASAGTALVSWSGSMFEYLMPLLVMQSFPFTLLDQTYRGAVRRQIGYGAERGVPWGISESAYNVRDRNQTYQYRAFGVPDLALKRGLAKELVVAPYATMLAVMVEPHAALANARVLEREGSLGGFGFREALDYTRPAESGDGRPTVVRSYFAHHVGMGLVALTNVLRRNVWQSRFHADPMVRSAELILYERIPRRLVLQETQQKDVEEVGAPAETEKPAVREFETADTPQPRVALLGNLPYTIMVTNGGAGYSRYQSEQDATVAVTRWRADGTRDATGQWCYVKDLATGRVWSAAHQPVGAPAEWYRAALATDRVVFQRRDGDVETVTEIAVVPDDRAEVRRVTVVNHGEEEREIELTSYGEIVLAPPDTDRAHPAFANLFVETEWLASHSAVIASRRPRSAAEKRLWCVHVAAVAGEAAGPLSCETDRARFVGRGRSVRDPLALEEEGPLSGTVGAVLDPIFALRARVRVAPGKSARVAFTTLMSEDRARAEELADRYNDAYGAQRALDLAWTQTQVELRDLGITPADAALYQQLAGHLFYAHPGLRAPQRELQQNQGAQPMLWAHGISGDWPILLALIDSTQGLPTLRQLLAAHHYWRLKGMTVDLVILNTHPPTYLQELNDQLVTTVMASSEAGVIDRPGGVFIRRQDVLNAKDLLMLRATARVHVPCDGLPLGQLLERRELGVSGVTSGDSVGGGDGAVEREGFEVADAVTLASAASGVSAAAATAASVSASVAASIAAALGGAGRGAA